MSRRVIVIEDDESLRSIVCEVLRDESFVVDEAEDGVAAETLIARSEAYDVIVLDNDMPRLGGLALLERLRDRGYLAPAVMCTGSQPPSAAESERLGIRRVLQKPIPLHELTVLVHALARGH